MALALKVVLGLGLEDQVLGLGLGLACGGLDSKSGRHPCTEHIVRIQLQLSY